MRKIYEQNIPKEKLQLAFENINLMYYMLLRYKLTYDYEANDVAFDTLLYAINVYDETRGTKLSNWVCTNISKALSKYLVKKNKYTIQSLDIMQDYLDERKVGWSSISMSTDSAYNSFEDKVLSDMTIEDMTMFVDQEIKLMSKKGGVQEQILMEWYNSNYTMPHADIAKKLNVTRSYVSKLIKQIKLRLERKLLKRY